MGWEAARMPVPTAMFDTVLFFGVNEFAFELPPARPVGYAFSALPCTGAAGIVGAGGAFQEILGCVAAPAAGLDPYDVPLAAGCGILEVSIEKLGKVNER